jgi:hypothetical protein
MLVECELSKIESFDFHGIAYQFTCFLNFDYRMVSCHIVEKWEIVRFVVGILDSVLSHFLGVDDLRVKLCLVGRYGTVKIHKIFCERAGLIEAGKLDHPTRNDLILLNTKDRFLIEFLNGVNDSKGHADR